MKALAKLEGADVDRLKAMDTVALRAEMHALMGVSARNLLYLAAMWVELERRGEDLSGLRTDRPADQAGRSCRVARQQ